MNIIEIISLITLTAQAHGVNPQLALSIASVESKLNPAALGSHGEIGLFQVKPKSVGLSKEALLNPTINIQAGIKYLKYSMDHCHTKVANTGIICYNAGVTGAKGIAKPKEFDYYKKVMKVKQSLNDALIGVLKWATYLKLIQET